MSRASMPINPGKAFLQEPRLWAHSWQIPLTTGKALAGPAHDECFVLTEGWDEWTKSYPCLCARWRMACLISLTVFSLGGRVVAGDMPCNSVITGDTSLA